MEYKRDRGVKYRELRMVPRLRFSFSPPAPKSAVPLENAQMSQIKCNKLHKITPCFSAKCNQQRRMARPFWVSFRSTLKNGLNNCGFLHTSDTTIQLHSSLNLCLCLSKEYYDALISRATPLSKMTEEDLKASPNSVSSITVPSLILVGVVSILQLL